ncbi:hypothetical protein IG631_03073 [Alternaria alternata]|nr:hypothetical protein IG631_03073 [Alternaria alternata]
MQIQRSHSELRQSRLVAGSCESTAKSGGGGRVIGAGVQASAIDRRSYDSPRGRALLEIFWTA